MATTIKYNAFLYSEMVEQAFDHIQIEKEILESIDTNALDNPEGVGIRFARVMKGLGLLSELSYVVNYCKDRNPDEIDLRIDGETLAAINEWAPADRKFLEDFYRDKLGVDVSGGDDGDDVDDGPAVSGRVVN